eukprot:3423797-Amphidinium_carterae.1
MQAYMSPRRKGKSPWPQDRTPPMPPAARACALKSLQGRGPILYPRPRLVKRGIPQNLPNPK